MRLAPPWLSKELEDKMDSKQKAHIETGIRGDQITLRISEDGGLSTTLFLPPEQARTIGERLIGQANLVAPKKVTR